MKLQVGDRVKFLNTTGGGIVTKVIDSKMVMVSDTDGFEIPTLISELVRIDGEEPGARFFDEPFATPPSPVHKEEIQEAQIQDENKPDYLDPHIVRNRKSEDVFLAFVPHDQKWLITGLVDVFLINNTSYDTIYNLFHRTSLGHFSGVDYGSVFAGSRHLIDTVSWETLTHWCDGSLQLLFHKEQQERLLPPFNSEFRIDPKKFHKEGTYRESPLIKAKGLVVRIVALAGYLKEEAVPVSESKSPGKEKEPGEQPLIYRYWSADREAVVDLHIHELIEDPGNLEKSETLDFQKKFFLRCLDSAIEHRFLKVVFIHGVGNGTLRNSLTDLLKKTEGIEWFDAPMSNYGVGAIEVRIPHNL
ncbi:MAG: DUF2027 domain-containing protein [bacterium]